MTPDPGPRLPPGYGYVETLAMAMSPVYLAEHFASGRRVALRLVREPEWQFEGVPPERARRRFRVVCRSRQGVAHPNVVPLIDFGDDPGAAFTAEAYRPAGTLEARVRHEPAGVPWAARATRDAARGVAAVHRANLVHRDVKLGNLFLGEGDAVMLSGFELARPADSPADDPFGGMYGSIVGTPVYMPPEAIRGDRPAPAADIYALGVVLYRLLTGRLPFAWRTPVETFLAVMHEEPPAPRRLSRHVPRALEAACLRCLAKSPAERFADADALADALEPFA